MAPAQIPVILSQKPSTENGKFCAAVLRLAWLVLHLFKLRVCSGGWVHLRRPGALGENRDPRRQLSVCRVELHPPREVRSVGAQGAGSGAGLF